jgi:hypothetical protein
MLVCCVCWLGHCPGCLRGTNGRQVGISLTNDFGQEGISPRASSTCGPTMGHLEERLTDDRQEIPFSSCLHSMDMKFIDRSSPASLARSPVHPLRIWKSPQDGQSGSPLVSSGKHR